MRKCRIFGRLGAGGGGGGSLVVIMPKMRNICFVVFVGFLLLCVLGFFFWPGGSVSHQHGWP